MRRECKNGLYLGEEACLQLKQHLFQLRKTLRFLIFGFKHIQL